MQDNGKNSNLKEYEEIRWERKRKYCLCMVWVSAVLLLAGSVCALIFWK